MPISKTASNIYSDAMSKSKCVGTARRNQADIFLFPFIPFPKNVCKDLSEHKILFESWNLQNLSQQNLHHVDQLLCFQELIKIS